MYFGPANEAIPYFSRLDYVCPTYQNPADYFIDLVTVDYRGEEVEAKTQARVDKLIKAYDDKGPPESQQIIEKLEETARQQEDKMALVENRRYATSTFFQFRTLVGRQWKNSIRDPAAKLLRFIRSVTIGECCGYNTRF